MAKGSWRTSDREPMYTYFWRENREREKKKKKKKKKKREALKNEMRRKHETDENKTINREGGTQ